MRPKRAREGIDNEGPRKAPKRVDPPAPVQPVPVKSGTQLRQLLRFQQSDVEALRLGQASLKALLDSINDQRTEDLASERNQKVAIVKEYLDDRPADLLQTWSFASQVDNERLVIATTSNIALLLRTLSGLIDLRDHGLAFGKQVLQREHLKLLHKGLSAESHKEALISPCLRILTELVSFDGGVLALPVFMSQDFTYDLRSMSRNLRLSKAVGEEDRRRSSVRSNAVRYILAHLRHQSVDNKISMLDTKGNGSEVILRIMLENVRQDPPDLLDDILKTVEASILRDVEIPRIRKSSLMTERVLMSVVDAVRALPDDSKAGQAALDFLHRICTSTELGVHLPSSWYPPSRDHYGESDFGGTDNGKEVQNIILFNFIQSLRAHSDLRERHLFLETLKSTPELVAAYLRHSAGHLSLMPKLSNTWLGYASLMYSMIELPVPSFFGSSSFRSRPPRIDIILENLLPSPLTCDVLTRCLNQSSGLIAFFACRVLVLTLQKAARVQNSLQTAAKTFGSYKTASSTLAHALAKRLPSFKTVVSAYQTIAKYEESVLAQEAVLHALRSYLQIIPETVSDHFDVAGPLAVVLESLQHSQVADEASVVLQVQLTHLLEMARTSVGIQWWHRQGRMVYSPFVTILKLITESPIASGSRKRLVQLLSQIAYEEGTLQSSTNASAMDALLATLEPSNGWTAGLETWRFLEDCFSRLHKKPIKYLDDLDELLKRSADPSDQLKVSHICLVIHEQIPFVTRLAEEDRDNVLNWTLRFAKALKKIGELKEVVKPLRKRIEDQKFNAIDPKFRKIADRDMESPEVDSICEAKPEKSDEAEQAEREDRGLTIDFTPPPTESHSHPELTKFRKQDLDELVQGETLDQLMLCLCSDYQEIRKQGTQALQQIMDRLEQSDLEAKDQLWTLLGDLVETAMGTPDEKPMSFVAGAFATAARKILLDPTHLMYHTVNRYLLKDPYFHVRKLPDHFLRKAILEAPAEMNDDKYWPQLEWILSFLVEGTRRLEDAAVLRHRNGLERLMLIVHSPGATTEVLRLTMRLVHRVASVGAGTMLATNAAVCAWLSSLETTRVISTASIQELRKAVEEAGDKARVQRWQGVGMDVLDTQRPNAGI